MHARLSDWRSNLDLVIRDYSAQPFVWGSRDCAHFAADCVAAVIGVDPLGTLRGSWNSRQTCKARLLRRGWKSNREACAGLMLPIGSREISKSEAMFGDIGVSPCGAMAVKLQPGFVARDARGSFGLVSPVVIWSVGH